MATVNLTRRAALRWGHAIMEASGRSGRYLYVERCFFFADLSVTSGNSHLSFLPVVSVSADKALSALAASLFTIFLIPNLTHLSLSH